MEAHALHLWCYHWSMSRASDIRRTGSHGLPPRKVRSAAYEREFRVSVTSSSSHRPRRSDQLLRPSRLPLSAFIAEDMNEFVHAHATYRFVIFDEEEERPRILVRHSSLEIVLPGSADAHLVRFGCSSQ